MNGLIYTKHAKMRSNQRGIRKDELDVIIEFGKKKRSRDGSVSYYMTKRTCETAKRALGSAYVKLSDNIRSKAVVLGDDGMVITVLNRTRRKYN